MLKIAIIEDDLFYANLLKNEIFKSKLGIAKVFISGETFFRETEDYPDLVLLDYNLGKINGKQVLEMIKRFSTKTKVVLISGQEDNNLILNLLKQGAFGYLEKSKKTFLNLVFILKLIKFKE